MRKEVSYLLAFLALAAAIPAGGAPAQDESEARGQRGAGAPGESHAMLIDLEFNGNTVGEFVDAIRRATADANIVIDDEARDVPFPPVKLTGVAIFSALGLLDDLEPPDGTFELEAGLVLRGGGQPIYLIRTTKHRPPHEEIASAQPITHVWSVAALLAETDLNPEAILTAVETAIALQPEFGEPKIRFHEDSGLLIARGHPQHVSAIDAVVSQLYEGRSDVRRQPLRVPQLERQVQQLVQERDQLLQRINQLEQQLRQLQEGNG